MTFIRRHNTLFGFISTACSQNLFQKNEDFENVFCGNKMIPLGIKRTSRECGKSCSLNILCTGFFYDYDKYCFLTEEHMSDVNTCSFRESWVRTSFLFQIKSSEHYKFKHSHLLTIPT